MIIWTAICSFYDRQLIAVIGVFVANRFIFIATWRRLQTFTWMRTVYVPDPVCNHCLHCGAVFRLPFWYLPVHYSSRSKMKNMLPVSFGQCWVLKVCLPSSHDHQLHPLQTVRAAAQDWKTQPQIFAGATRKLPSVVGLPFHSIWLTLLYPHCTDLSWFCSQVRTSVVIQFFLDSDTSKGKHENPFRR